MSAGSALAEGWRRRGRELEIGGRRIFAVEAGAPGAPCIALLHGFPSSSLDFHRVVDALAARHRVVLHDHLGFGFSDKPRDEAYSLFEQAELAVAVWRRLGAEPTHLVAHDYGTSVATELLARRERGLLQLEPASVTLSNGSVLLELARLRLSQRIARSAILGPLFGRLVTWRYFRRVMRRLWADPARAEDADLEAIWQALRFRGGHLVMHRVSGYLAERVRFRRRWAEALQRLDLPAHILWGRQDPVARPAIAERLVEIVPGATLTWLEDCGHYPMLERPQAWAAEALGFLEAGAGRNFRPPGALEG